MFDFKGIESLVGKFASTDSSTVHLGGAGKESVFKSLLLQMQLKAMSTFAGNPDAGNNIRSPMQDFRPILEMLVRKQGGNKLINDPSVSQQYLKSYEYGLAQGNSSNSFQNMATEAARRQGVPESFFRKLITLESNFQPDALSPKGAMGLGQLMPRTAEELGLRIHGDRSAGSVWDPESNLNASARYLNQLHSHYQKRGVAQGEAWTFAAAAYNAGIGNIDKAINLLAPGDRLELAQVMKVLPEVTGSHSRETIRYVNRLGT